MASTVVTASVRRPSRAVPRLSTLAALTATVGWDATASTWAPTNQWVRFTFALIPWGFFILAALSWGVAAAAIHRGARGPAALRMVDRVGLVAPTRLGPTGGVLGAILLGGTLVMAPDPKSSDPLERRGGVDELPHRVSPTGAVLAVVFGALFAVAAVMVLAGRPRLVLTPSGLEPFGPLWTTSIPWAALRADLPVSRNRYRLLIAVGWPRLVVRRELRAGAGRSQETVPLGTLAVDPAFLVGAVQFYLEHPGSRAEIGTPAGSQALTAGLTTP